MLKMPPPGHDVRKLMPERELMALSPSTVMSLPTLTEAREDARRTFKIDRARNPGAARVLLVNRIVRHEDGRILLMSFGPKGGYRTRWNFGRLSPPAKITGRGVSLVAVDDPHPFVLPTGSGKSSVKRYWPQHENMISRAMVVDHVPTKRSAEPENDWTLARAQLRREAHEAHPDLCGDDCGCQPK